jgi:hypothetical protein
VPSAPLEHQVQTSWTLIITRTITRNTSQNHWACWTVMRKFNLRCGLCGGYVAAETGNRKSDGWFWHHACWIEFLTSRNNQSATNSATPQAGQSAGSASGSGCGQGCS